MRFALLVVAVSLVGCTQVAGPQGRDGRDGLAGAMGPQGVAGPAGAKGADGISAISVSALDGGCARITGADGGFADICNGTNGTNGIAGTKGDTGAQGPQGIQGVQGIQGKPGPSLAVKNQNGTVLGTVIGMPDLNYGVTAWVKDWNCMAKVNLVSHTFEPVKIPALGYDGLNCTGNVIVDRQSNGYPFGCYSNNDGSVMLRPMQPIFESEIVVRSSRNQNGTCVNGSTLFAKAIPLEVFTPAPLSGPLMFGQD